MQLRWKGGGPIVDALGVLERKAVRADASQHCLHSSALLTLSLPLKIVLTFLLALFSLLFKEHVISQWLSTSRGNRRNRQKEVAGKLFFRNSRRRCLIWCHPPLRIHSYWAFQCLAWIREHGILVLGMRKSGRSHWILQNGDNYSCSGLWVI